MAKFAPAFAKIIELEGGYIDHEDDRGGPTNYGISLRWLKSTGDIKLGDIDGDGDIDHQDIYKMTISDVSKLYWKYWWHKYDYEEINDQDIANKLFDMAINMGARQAHKLLQRAVNSLRGDDQLVDDGLIGWKTRTAINSALEVSAIGLLAALRAHQEGFYRTLLAGNPKFEAFIKGWIRRARS
jgi:lysozyme family protein